MKKKLLIRSNKLVNSLNELAKPLERISIFSFGPSTPPYKYSYLFHYYFSDHQYLELKDKITVYVNDGKLCHCACMSVEGDTWDRTPFLYFGP